MRKITLILAAMLVGCASPRDYDFVPESIIYKTPDWSGGFEYKVRFEPKTTGGTPTAVVE